MVARLLGITLLWGIRFSLAWFIVHEYLSVVGEKLTAVSHALGVI